MKPEEVVNVRLSNLGGLAQLARASALHAEGHRFDSDILHHKNRAKTLYAHSSRDEFRLSDKVRKYTITYKRTPDAMRNA